MHVRDFHEVLGDRAKSLEEQTRCGVAERAAGRDPYAAKEGGCHAA